MPSVPKLIAEFPKCFNCGSTEKVSELGCAEAKEKGKIAKDAFTTLRQQVTPLEQPTLAGLMVQVVVTYFDVCYKCGRERCTKAELVMAPVQMQVLGKNPGGNKPPWMGKR